MENPRIIGHVVSVNGFRVKVELLTEARSPSRATLDGVQTAAAINSYLTFSIGSGLSIIGVISDLEARESYDPSSGDDLSLELLKARRVASVQLLGTIERDGEQWRFNPGITVLPTLDTPAEIGSPKVLAAVFENPPQKNKPDNYEGEGFDFDLVLGCPTGQKDNRVKASYNDLFSRPLAIVGNTGSGKSYTVASVLKKAMVEIGDDEKNAPHVFILDINGEYARAFLSEESARLVREPDRIYLNGQEFGVPLWFFNAQEICGWLSAAEQTQEPVLKDWWAISKAKNAQKVVTAAENSLRYALTKVEHLIQCLDDKNGPKKLNLCSYFKVLKDYIGALSINGLSQLEAELSSHQRADKNDWTPPSNEVAIRKHAVEVQEALRKEVAKSIEEAGEIIGTADTPLPVAIMDLDDPTLLNRSVRQEDVSRIDAHLTTLKLRLKTRLDDKRWQAFLNYEKDKTRVLSFDKWLDRFGFLEQKAPRVSIVDLSMLAHETLPYACGVIGRILLEVRERLPAHERFCHPWVLVLEEAHNYAKPARQDEDRGQALSRIAFERIAKEGRKFGLSLIVASQRPSEISPTIISQCANFVSHRLQNPDDIDHFRRIIPMQARRLLDQVTVLASGEAIVFGSAFHIPARVQIDMPEPPPWSQTAAPYHQWKENKTCFPVDTIIKNWGLEAKTETQTNNAPVADGVDDL
ncbi:MAG TPA: DUF87 domain-containing protein [Candidatus Omnitrophota bacterium]|nr:DUF87 domain-containing protein [Candidatus Omnitrophota bacterium]